MLCKDQAIGPILPVEGRAGAAETATMISLKRYLDDWDDLRSRGRLTFEAYLGALEALESAVGAMAAGEGQQFLRELRVILAYLRADPSPANIKRSRADLEQAIKALVEVINQRELEYLEIIRIMADAGATMAQTGAAHGEELRQIAGKVESITHLDSIVEVRRQLVAHMDELRSMAERVQEESAAKAREWERELASAREKLRATAVLAETDSLTGLGNRRRAESAVEEGIANGEALSVLLLDLDNFKAVNDAHGHAQGDSLLKAFVNSVRRCLRDSDLMCRWGGDEFVAIMYGATLEAAQDVVERIRSQAFGEFVLERAGQSAVVYVGASIGAVAHRPNESASELLERADQMMYEEKARSQRSAARAGNHR